MDPPGTRMGGPFGRLDEGGFRRIVPILSLVAGPTLVAPGELPR